VNFTLPNDHDAEAALRAARDTAVACDLGPLHVLAVAGADAAAFLQGQLSCDVKAVTPGTCRYGSFNSPKGRMLANFVLWRDTATADGFAMLLPGDIAEGVAKRLRMYVLRSKVTLTDACATIARIGLGGPAAGKILRAALGSIPAPLDVRHVDSATILSLPGPRFVILSSLTDAEGLRARFAAGATITGFDAWRWLTIRAGMPVVTAPTQDAFVAQAANWDILGGIDFQKGCYTGQEIIARTQYLGRLKERTFAFHSETEAAAAGDRLFSAAFDEQPCGTVVNAAPAPGGGCDLLAVLQMAAAERGDARLHTPDGPRLTALPLPYAIPAAKPPRERDA
jgi:tRNA-modifying protein YgfZ